MRTKGSCRFAAYYKVQFWDERQLAWHDVQKAHAAESEARAAFVAGKRCRVMMITEKGREPMP